MPAYKDKRNNTWYSSCYGYDQNGNRVKKMKRGFKTKKDALKYENEYILKSGNNLEMKMSSFISIYIEDITPDIRESTLQTKLSIINKHIIPYFGEKKVNSITRKNIVDWQNNMKNHQDKTGKSYSPTYLKTIRNCLSAIFNHAVKIYNLPESPMKGVKGMGKRKAKEQQYWSQDEYMKFSEAIMNKPMSYYAFQILYWTGIREGELLALVKSDFNFVDKTLSITKSYQRLNKKDVITPPKTEESIREVNLPNFLCEEIQEYFDSLYAVPEDCRIFPVTKSYLQKEMKRGSQIAKIKRIRVHDLRHSHISYLINNGFSAFEIAKRVGHSATEITYTYAHLFPNKGKEIANKLDEDFNLICSTKENTLKLKE
ncbi:MAG: site-specific integrase [Ruminococcus sp.]|nr:site-specific integrase [Ruminococcus sp.]